MGPLRMDFLHCALLAVVVVLLAVYVARGSGLFREGASGSHDCTCATQGVSNKEGGWWKGCSEDNTGPQTECLPCMRGTFCKVKGPWSSESQKCHGKDMTCQPLSSKSTCGTCVQEKEDDDLMSANAGGVYNG